MDKYERITDDAIFKAIESVNNDNEQALKDAIKTLLFVTLDTRQFLRKIYKNMEKRPRIYKKPTNNKNNIVFGGE